MLANADGRILCANRHAKSLFGYTGQDLEGQPLDILVPEWFTHGVRLSQNFVSIGDRLAHGAEELFGRRQDGEEFRLYLIATVLTGAAPALIAVALRAVPSWTPDLGITPAAFNQREGKTTHYLAQALALVTVRLASERQNQSLRKRTDKALQNTRATEDQMRALQAVTDTALAHLELDALLPALLDRVRDALNVDNAIVFLLEEDEQGGGNGDIPGKPRVLPRVLVRAARGPQAGVASEVRIPGEERFVGRIMTTRQPLIATDLSTYPNLRRWLQEQASSAAGAPLLLQDRVAGVLFVTTAEPHRFTLQDVMLLQRVAERVTVATERGQRYEAERQAKVEAEAARAEAQVARAEAVRQAEQLDRIVEAMGEALLVYDTHGRLVRSNAAAHRLLGLDSVPPGYYGLSLEERISLYAPRASNGGLPSPQAWLAQRASRDVDVLREPEARDVHLRTLDGRELEVSVSITPLRDPDGQVMGGVLVLNDRTERNRLAREREEARASELALRDMNQRLDTFVAMAAHDLRRPVTVSKLRIELAQRQVQQAVSHLQSGSEHNQLIVQVAQALEVARRNIDRLTSLLEQLLDVTRARQGALVLNRQPCDLVALVRGCVEEQRLLTPDRTLTLDLLDAHDAPDPDGRSIIVQADGTRISQALTNYLTNAERYSPGDQPIEIALRVVEQASGRTDSAPHHIARVSVRDHGPGIAPEAKTVIWDRFQRARSLRDAMGGLGLGLYIARMIIEFHGGQVGVESTLGEGSTFWFTLPLAPVTD